MNADRKPIIVTGGFGFIGASMVRRLVNQGEKVIVFAKKTSTPQRLNDLRDSIIWYEEDLSDRVRLAERIASANPKGIFHFAASNIQSGATAADGDVIQTNILGTVNLVEAAKGVPYDFFIYTGTFLEYGSKDHAFKEDDLPEPSNVYAVSKLAASLYCQAIAKKDKQPIVVLRLMTPYGPDMQKGRLMYELVERSLQGMPLILTHPKVARDFIYVTDVLDLCLEAASKAQKIKGEIYNVGSGVQTTLGELVDLVRTETSSQSEVQWGTFRQVAYDTDTLYADMTKTFSAFSWRPKVTPEEGIRHMANWFRKPDDSVDK